MQVPEEADNAQRSCTAALELAGVRKSFAGVTVLHDVDLTVRPSTIHGLVGHNGSGKSTLIKAMAGFHSPDTEVIASSFGTSFRLGDHMAAARAGLRFVHQDLGLVDQLSTVDNLALGAGFPRVAGMIRWRRAARRSEVQMASLGYHFDVAKPVGSLSAAERTAVAIARALQTWSGEPRVVVLDEPTAAMPAPEAKRLHDTMLRLRQQGLGVVLVSHHLDEVLHVADDITVLRGGQVVCTRPAQGMTHEDLVALVVGREIVSAHRTQRVVVAQRGAAPALVVEALSSAALHEVSLEVLGGEIVGVAGITGSGRDQLLRAIAGDISRTGTVRISDTVIAPHRPRAAIRAGLGLVAADRRRAAVMASFSAGANMTVTGLGDHVRMGLLNHRSERREAHRWIDDLEVQPSDVRAPILTLSGGNQQKVMVARWLRRRPVVLALDEPTQGVDVGARQAIYAAARRAADDGQAVLISSADTDELVALCDRVVVLVGGRCIAELSKPDMDAGAVDALALGSREVGA